MPGFSDFSCANGSSLSIQTGHRWDALGNAEVLWQSPRLQACCLRTARLIMVWLEVRVFPTHHAVRHKRIFPGVVQIALNWFSCEVFVSADGRLKVAPQSLLRKFPFPGNGDRVRAASLLGIAPETTAKSIAGQFNAALRFSQRMPSF
jgi:hypothetical protein